MAETPPTLMLATKQTAERMLGIVENWENQTTTRSAIPSKIQQLTFSDVVAKYHDSIRQMLGSFPDMWKEKLERINAVENRIDLTQDSRSFRFAPYQAGPETRKLEVLEIQKQLKTDVIKPTTAEWASPVLFVPKQDGSFQFCIDYRPLNEATIKDTYPLPRIDERIDSLETAKIFSTLDANSGYWQISFSEEDRDKTAFVCHAGLCRYKQMSFGLTNAPATFQRALDVILSGFI